MNCGNGTNCGCSTTNDAVQTNTQAITDPGSQTGSHSAQTYRPPANVLETAEKYQISLEVPGSSPDGIDVQIHEGVLSVTAKVPPRVAEGVRTFAREFGVGDFRRQFRVGEDIEAGAITAAYTAGVLTLDLPKSRKPEGRRVPVTPS